MGMESFNAVPEPVVPDESERIEDPAKAEEMAYAGKPDRDAATVRRVDAEAGVHPVDSLARASQLDKYADDSEREAGENFDRANDVSERVEDPAKAEEMAYAGKPDRDAAAIRRSDAEKGVHPADSIARANQLDHYAEDSEKEAGEKFDKVKEGTEN